MLKADKLKGLPPYIFARLDERVYKLRESGVRDIVDFGKADPDHSTPEAVVKRLQETAADPENHHYPAFKGSLFFREHVARWYQERFGVTVDPETEVIALLGSKEGLFHISLAYISQGDIGLVPDPSFPAYNDGVFFAGGEVLRLPLTRANGYLPDLDSLDEATRKRAKILFLNYPNNPTGVFAPPEFMERAIRFCREHEILLCYDHAYSEVYYDEHNKPKSLLEYPGGQDVGVEFFTFSKTFNMAGWRLGAAVGNKEVINSLLVVQSHINSGIFAPIQFAGVTALTEVTHSNFPQEQRAEYKRRFDYALGRFKAIGWDVHPPEGTVYLWVPTPEHLNGEEFANLLLDEYHVVVAPGTAFGETGDRYVRLSLTTEYENVVKGIDRICDALQKQVEPPALP
ncbi:LL-diaminopimelate aminotransferase [Tumebacillus sp. BK434]|uniref:aminotransferase class I/II-fold pyridoxal phosphate-dependent enzyme n=1 Tax=Tumebacillus sp. BK434 TaxID=2512169 RepID=UPI0010433F77|nr:aminotransferase class I/II-fold pyridoxal phosphate-dependent enzyme [Tumebacillus sp. BK434]TCP53803.1 LL-diaminopimelate aminotransferase [Tumebacillus sp. BK434]